MTGLYFREEINEGINTYLEANYDVGTHHFAPQHRSGPEATEINKRTVRAIAVNLKNTKPPKKTQKKTHN
jgi:hypothetical protein